MHVGGEKWMELAQNRVQGRTVLLALMDVWILLPEGCLVILAWNLPYLVGYL